MEPITTPEIRLLPLDESHRAALVEVLDFDESIGMGWSFRDCPTPASNVEKIFEQHLNTGFVWSICADGDPAGFLSVYYRANDQFVGYSTKTYISSRCRGLGINRLVKEPLISFCKQHGIPLFSRVAERNQRSLTATLKVVENIPEAFQGVFKNIHIFRLADGGLDRESDIPVVIEKFQKHSVFA